MVLFFSISTVAILGYASKARLDKWLVPYVRSQRKREQLTYPLHLHVAICNHYSPFWKGVSQEIAEHRVVTWCREYPKFALSHRDSEGKQPVHTFFYNESDYNPKFIDSLCKLHKDGLADVEILISKKHDTPEGLKKRVEDFRDVLFHHHNLLEKDQKGNINFGLIHESIGNKHQQLLNLSQAECDPSILKSSGCYADFSYPYTIDSAQIPLFNSIYFTPDQKVSVEQWSEEEMLHIQGPLAFNWSNRLWRMVPRIENGELGFYHRFTPQRIALWINSRVNIRGASNHLFIKLHTYGAVDCNVRYFFGEMGLHSLCYELENKYNDGQKYVLHYVSAREMYKRIKQLCINGKMKDKTHHLT
ncbi:hypothetical protein CHISP_0711 [Chitinispirillum alkaliphilum]|nr:hypothetical protein CHISP_0711 [Chitinispirillum alkaliphilum]